MAWTLALHGGAGLISPRSLDPVREARAREGLAGARDAGTRVLLVWADHTGSGTIAIWSSDAS